MSNKKNIQLESKHFIIRSFNHRDLVKLMNYSKLTTIGMDDNYLNILDKSQIRRRLSNWCELIDTQFIVVTRDTAQMIGMFSVNASLDRMFFTKEISYSFKNEDLFNEAIIVLIDYLFNTLKVELIVLNSDYMKPYMNNIGFTLEAVLRNKSRNNKDQLIDIYVYSLFKNDYKSI